jgi:hypothetical protein
MTIFTNTSHAAVLFTALISCSFASLSSPVMVPANNNDNNPWTILQKRDGIVISYDIQDCLKDNLLLTLKIMNDTDKAKKLRFRVDVEHADNTTESFNFIKSVAPYTTEKADCSEQSRQSGLVRMLRNGSEDSKVSIQFTNENGLALD